MIISLTVLVALTAQVCASAVVVTTKNVTCSGMRVKDGYRFPYDRPVGSEVSIYHIKTLLGYLDDGQKPTFDEAVLRLDNKSVVTRECKDLRIQLVSKGVLVNESWLNFNTIVDLVTPGGQNDGGQFIQSTVNPSLDTPESQTDNRNWIIIGGVLVAIIGGFGIFVVFAKMKRWGEAAIRGFCRNLLKTKSSGREETRSDLHIQLQNPKGFEKGVRVGLVHDVSATDPRAIDENWVKQESPHIPLHVDSGDQNTPDVDRGSHHGDMNRITTDDPRESSGDVRLEIPPSEDEPLVNKSSSQHQVNGCFATPGPDVESKPRMKNIRDYI